MSAQDESRRQVRTIGLVGGMSWQSTALYYCLVNETMNEALGGHHNARSVLVTVDFDDVLSPGMAGDWDAVAAILIDAVRDLERAGAECVVLTANTAHLVADAVERATDLPLLHIADVAADAIHAGGATKIGLLATRPTLESGIYADRLRDRHGIEVTCPSAEERDRLHAIIVDELAHGAVRDEARSDCIAMIGRLTEGGANGVLIACTELPLLIGQDHSPVPVFDTTRLHAEAAVAFALDPSIASDAPARTKSA